VLSEFGIIKAGTNQHVLGKIIRGTHHQRNGKKETFMKQHTKYYAYYLIYKDETY
jgi:hypothetical protein